MFWIRGHDLYIFGIKKCRETRARASLDFFLLQSPNLLPIHRICRRILMRAPCRSCLFHQGGFRREREDNKAGKATGSHCNFSGVEKLWLEVLRIPPDGLLAAQKTHWGNTTRRTPRVSGSCPNRTSGVVPE